MAFAIIGGRSRFWQWDVGQKLVVYDDTCGQVHFCNGTTECALVRTIYTLEDGTRVVDVPDIILQTAKPFTAYLYRVDEDSRETMRSYRFEVAARSKPADYGYVEPEGEGGNAGGLSVEAAALLLTILRNGVYTSDQSANIATLEAALAAGGDVPDDPVVPDLPEADVSQTGSILSIVSGVTATQNGNVLAIA